MRSSLASSGLARSWDYRAARTRFRSASTASRALTAFFKAISSRFLAFAVASLAKIYSLVANLNATVNFSILSAISASFLGLARFPLGARPWFTWPALFDYYIADCLPVAIFFPNLPLSEQLTFVVAHFHSYRAASTAQIACKLVCVTENI